MLDQTTKRQIDSARQILVGKVPDPKAQVEQITTAMIYKFMDDMDRENEDIGLKAQFFVDEYTKYSWIKLMDNRLSGQERMDLYVEAVANIPKNGNIPQLFRDIFKGAFLPFRDPRTLSLFLKEINEFSYENSENLGNSFEYLLSILGSQGDAGQFRTPRHIIDFIVEVVDPKKNETILDPACGTAGFLISAYKHIIKINSSNFNPAEEKLENKITQGETATETIISDKVNYTGDLMSPEDKTKLTQNIVGYDISPDMVKLALVNLYLHGFSDPKIAEYDTLSNDKRWGETFDVVLANPPFMTPKGGIVPHKKFSIQSKKAEVIFIDYILEHLNIKGRSGIIVPEGIIFNAQSDFKALRKKMVIDNWLWAVVSLPSGVFNPYADNKTNILFFDKEVSVKSDSIYFINIENDGYDLGLQRKAINKNDLPDAIFNLNNIKESILKNNTLKSNCNLSIQSVKKDIILENKQIKLLASEYIENHNLNNDKFTPLSKLLDQYSTKPLILENEYDYKVLGVRSHGKGCFISKIVKGKELKASLKYRPVEESSLFWCKVDTKSGGFGVITRDYADCVVTSNMATARINTKLVLPEYFSLIIASNNFETIVANASAGSTNRKYLTPTDLLDKIYIPLPDIKDQEKIVRQYEEIHKLQRELQQKNSNIEEIVQNLWNNL